jgi:transposase
LRNTQETLPRSVSTNYHAATLGPEAGRAWGKSGKKRAIIATARKLAVLLHHLWVSGEVYEPLHNSGRMAMPAAA